MAATDHLLALGHRRIAYIGGPANATCDQARGHGYLAAMRAAGIKVAGVITGDDVAVRPAELSTHLVIRDSTALVT